MSERAQTFVARIQKGFRVSIPQGLRKILELKEGEYIEVTVKKLLAQKEGDRNEAV